MKNIYGNDLPDLDKIQNQGLLAVKIAQVFALRIDFLNQEKCQCLSRLYSHTLQLPTEKIQQLLSQYTDEAFNNKFDFIDKRSLASASVGQVHPARLKDGSDVIVKIIKGDFRNNFLRDVRRLKKLFQFIIFFYHKLQRVADPVGILENIEEYTVKELNLLNEIKGQEILKEIYKENRNKFDLSKLRFPKIYKHLSSQNILVAEYIEGQTFDQLLEEGRLPYEKLLELFRVQGFYMFAIGTFHGDIHPGNIILKDNNLFFVDTSAINTAGEKIRKGLFEFFKALAYWDYKKCAHYLNKMADTEIDGDRYKEYEKKFLALYSDFTDTTVTQVSLTRRMMETIKLGVNSGMVFERGIFAIIKSLMYLDGMVLRCNPDAVVMKDMRLFIRETEKFINVNLQS